MPTTTMTSRGFNQDSGKAKKAAKAGPVIITDRGRPEHVLLSYDDFRKLSRKNKTIGELLAMPGIADLDFEFPRIMDKPGEIDFS